jgi:hypothetical protein
MDITQYNAWIASYKLMYQHEPPMWLKERYKPEDDSRFDASEKDYIEFWEVEG